MAINCIVLLQWGRLWHACILDQASVVTKHICQTFNWCVETPKLTWQSNNQLLTNLQCNKLTAKCCWLCHVLLLTAPDNWCIADKQCDTCVQTMSYNVTSMVSIHKSWHVCQISSQFRHLWINLLLNIPAKLFPISVTAENWLINLRWLQIECDSSHIQMFLQVSKHMTQSFKMSFPQIFLVLWQEWDLRQDVNVSKLNCPMANPNQLQVTWQQLQSQLFCDVQLWSFAGKGFFTLLLRVHPLPFSFNKSSTAQTAFLTQVLGNCDQISCLSGVCAFSMFAPKWISGALSLPGFVVCSSAIKFRTCLGWCETRSESLTQTNTISWHLKLSLQTMAWIHTLGSTFIGWNSESHKVCAKDDHHEKLANFNLCNALVSANTSPQSLPHSMLPSNHILLMQGAFKHAFCELQAMMLTLFNAAIRKPSHTLSLETTLEQVMDDGASVMCPLVTKWAFCSNIMWMSNTMWHPISWCPMKFLLLPLCMSSGVQPSCHCRAAFTFNISLFKAFCQQSSLHVCIDLQGLFNWMWQATPNLWVICQCLDFTFDVIQFHLCGTCGTHHANAGSFAIQFTTTCLATSIRFETFKSFSFSQLNDPSFHWTSNSQPFAVIFGLSRHPSCAIMPSHVGAAKSSFQWLVISSMIACMSPSLSTCANMFSVMMFATCFSIAPSVNSISHSRVSKRGSGCTWPTVSPSSPHEHLMTHLHCSSFIPMSMISSTFKHWSMASSSSSSSHSPTIMSLHSSLVGVIPPSTFMPGCSLTSTSLMWLKSAPFSSAAESSHWVILPITCQSCQHSHIPSRRWSSWATCSTDVLETNCPISVMIQWQRLEPTAMQCNAPSHHPSLLRLSLTSGSLGWSHHQMRSQKPKSNHSLMSGMLPVTSLQPDHLLHSCDMCASNSLLCAMPKSHDCFGAFFFCIRSLWHHERMPISHSARWFWFLWPASVACKRTCTCQACSTNSVLSPVNSLTPSVTSISGTPTSSVKSIKDLPASALKPIGTTFANFPCVKIFMQVFPSQDSTFDDTMSACHVLCETWWWRFKWSTQTHLNIGCTTIQTPCCMVTSSMSFAISNPMFHLHADSSGLTFECQSLLMSLVAFRSSSHLLMSSQCIVTMFTAPINCLQKVIKFKAGNSLSSSCSTCPHFTALDEACSVRITDICVLWSLDVKFPIIHISFCSHILVPSCTSGRSQVSAAIKRTGECFSSQLVSTWDSKCTIVPVVLNGMKTLFTLMPNLFQLVGSSQTGTLHCQIWFRLMSEFSNWFPNQSIWLPMSKHSCPAFWHVQTAQHCAAGISLTGSQESRKGLTSHAWFATLRSFQFAPAQQASACMSNSFQPIMQGVMEFRMPGACQNKTTHRSVVVNSAAWRQALMTPWKFLVCHADMMFTVHVLAVVSHSQTIVWGSALRWCAKTWLLNCKKHQSAEWDASQASSSVCSSHASSVLASQFCWSCPGSQRMWSAPCSKSHLSLSCKESFPCSNSCHMCSSNSSASAIVFACSACLHHHSDSPMPQRLNIHSPLSCRFNPCPPGSVDKESLEPAKKCAIVFIKTWTCEQQLMHAFLCIIGKSNRNVRTADHTMNRLTLDATSLCQHVEKSTLMDVKILDQIWLNLSLQHPQIHIPCWCTCIPLPCSQLVHPNQQRWEPVHAWSHHKPTKQGLGSSWSELFWGQHDHQLQCNLPSASPSQSLLCCSQALRDLLGKWNLHSWWHGCKSLLQWCHKQQKQPADQGQVQEEQAQQEELEGQQPSVNKIPQMSASIVCVVAPSQCTHHPVWQWWVCCHWPVHLRWSALPLQPFLGHTAQDHAPTLWSSWCPHAWGIHQWWFLLSCPTCWHTMMINHSHSNWLPNPLHVHWCTTKSFSQSIFQSIFPLSDTVSLQWVWQTEWIMKCLPHCNDNKSNSKHMKCHCKCKLNKDCVCQNHAAKAAHFLHARGIFQSCLMPLTHPNLFEGSAQKIVISAQKNAGSINLYTAKLPDQNSKHRKTHSQHIRLLAQAQNRKQLTQHRINKLSTASCRLSTENCHLSTENCHLRTKKCWINQSQKSKLPDQNSKLLRKHSRQLAESEHSKPWNQAEQSKLHSQCSKLLAQTQHRKLLPQHSKLQAQHRKLSSQHRKCCLSTENCWINQSQHSKFPAENSKLLSKHNRQLAESEHSKLWNQDKHRKTCSQHSKPSDQAQHRKLLSHHSKKTQHSKLQAQHRKLSFQHRKLSQHRKLLD